MAMPEPVPQNHVEPATAAEVATVTNLPAPVPPTVAAPTATAPAVQYVPVPTTVVAVVPKSVGIAYVLWVFFGLVGVHQFYLGNAGRGLLYLLLCWCGVSLVGCIIDLFTLPGQVRKVNRAMGVTDPRLAL